jgi:hypothetical protein
MSSISVLKEDDVKYPQSWWPEKYKKVYRKNYNGLTNAQREILDHLLDGGYLVYRPFSVFSFLYGMDGELIKKTRICTEGLTMFVRKTNWSDGSSIIVPDEDPILAMISLEDDFDYAESCAS